MKLNLLNLEWQIEENRIYLYI